MPNLTIFLLGPPQFFVDGKEVTGFNTRKDRALLAYLAVTGTTHSRETLAGLLWSELPEASARRNLRHALSHLQKVIGPQWLVVERGVALTRDQPWSVDVHTLHVTVKKLTAHQSVNPERNDSELIEVLNRVLDLYRGEFLQGFNLPHAEHFGEWVLAQRQDTRLLMLRGLEILVQRCLVQGAYAAGLTATHRLLHLEPWSEPAHCLQMQLLAQSGRRAEALDQYATCRKVLAAELGVAPLPATTALYEQIQAGNYTGPAGLAQREWPMPRAVALPTAPATVVGKPVAPNNLVKGLAAFIGRQTELDSISQQLAATDCRLLTIVGPGGVGKTSLAQAAAQRILHAKTADFSDGIYFISLLDIGAAEGRRSEPTLVDDPAFGEAILRAIAEQIGYKLETGVAPDVQLHAYLRARRLLLILDNFEHLLAGTAAIVTLLTHAPQLKVLITSRTRLNVRGERLLTLVPLLLPTVAYHAAVESAQANPVNAILAEAWQTSEAVAMFVQRAQQVDLTFVLNAEMIGPVGQICHLVDGLPLGIELATSMLPLISCNALAATLAGSLEVLVTETRDIPRAQRTLGAVFEQSWQLLPPDGQQLLARLAIFPVSFSLNAATHIAGATAVLLRRLLDHSLLSKVEDERYVMHRTVHAFAQQKFHQWPEQRATLQSHYAHFYLESLARLEQEQTEAAYADVTTQIQVELDNVRTAWRWSVDQSNLVLLELSAGSLQEFYQRAGIYPEAFRLMEGALPAVRHVVALAPMAAQPQRLLARLLCYTAQFYRLSPGANDIEKAEAWANEALELGQRLADPALQGLAYHELARLAQVRGDFAAMYRLAEQGCTYARQANLPQLNAENLNDFGVAVSVGVHPLAGIPHFHAALDWQRQRPNHILESRIIINLALFNLAGHNYQAAYHYYHQPTLQHLFENWSHAGDLFVALGAYPEAQQKYAQGFVLIQARQTPYWESWLHASYGCLQRLWGDPVAAQTACRLALQMAQNTGNHFVVPLALINLGYLRADQGDFVAAGHYYQQALALETAPHWSSRATEAYAGLAAIYLAQNETASALIHAEAALARLVQYGLAAAGEPFWVYLTCVRVLQTAGDPRAQTILASAYQLLQKTADQLEDARFRRSFLENVRANRELVATAQAAGLVTDPTPLTVKN